MRMTYDRHDIEEIMRLTAQGMTRKRIGERFGVSKAAICGLVWRQRQLQLPRQPSSFDSFVSTKRRGDGVITLPPVRF